ncbi:MAG: hypothetical protein ACR2KP_17645 [Egibacteraceae bacterium]|jgi:hypothetical protein
MTDLYRRFDGYDELKSILEGSDEDVLVALGGKPALVRIPGTTSGERRARFLACLLHGNEDSGFRAVVDLLRGTPHFPFDLWVLIGNVRAATTDGWFAHRYLDDQEDFNRVWGVEQRTTRMRRCAAAVLTELAGVDLEAAVDFHNNTGDNPAYAITPSATQASLRLASSCAGTVLLWRLRAHTLMEALQPQCPAVALECGLPQRAEHTAFAAAALQRFLSDLDLGLDTDHPAPGATRLYEMRYRVTVRPEVAFTFGGALTGELDLVLTPALDGANFGMLLAGTEVGHVAPGTAVPLDARDMRDADVTERLFSVTDEGALVLREDVTPVMMTTTVRQARRDCLFYVARRRR